MKSKSELKIAVAQLCSTDQVSTNQKHILDLLETLNEPVDVVFLPENSLFMKISRHSEKVAIALDDPVYLPFIDWAKKHNTHLLFGANPTQLPTGTGNSTIWIRPDGSVENPYNKIHLFDVDVEGEKPVRESDQFVAGDQLKIIDINGWKIGLSICYDLRFSKLYDTYGENKVDVIAIPAAFLVPTGQAHWHVLQRARAIESQCYVVASAQAGVHIGQNGGTRSSYGHSLVIDPWGKVQMDLGEEPNRISVASLSRERVDQVRRQIPMANHRKL